ncbi:MAG: hypothetical protein U1F41_09500 [Burkholderiales bacterium]
MTSLTPGAWLGIALFAGYAIWVWAFFTHVRPRAMRAVARRLRTRVAESLNVEDAGTWSTDDDAPLTKTGAVMAADLALLLAGTVGVAAAVFVPAFIVADSGALLPMESRITGRTVELGVGPANAMTADSPRVALPVQIDNKGASDLRACRAMVDGYTARNGYLHGTSPTFDLAPGARVATTVRVEVLKPVKGEHELRIKLECDNERLAVAKATLNVR